nr:putative ribonuclease H-like domain-containing protein [Tanacetum cinerariifolium]
MAYTSGSNTKVKYCSKNCAKTYEKLQKQFNEQKQTLNKDNLEIVAYQLGLESIEAQLIVHQKNDVAYKEKIPVLEFEIKDKGYGDQLSESDSEVLSSVSDSRSSDGYDNSTNDRFQKGDGYHAVPPPLIRNYMPPLADVSFAGLDDSVYRPTTNKASASISKVHNTKISKETVNTVRINGVNIVGQKSVSTVEGNRVTAVKTSVGCVWRPKITDLNNVSKDSSGSWISKGGNPQQAIKYKGMFDSGCSRHMTWNKALLTDYQDIDGGFVPFGVSTKGGKITSIGKIRTNKIDFEDVFFVKELKFNLFSVSQMCDKKNIVLFTESECLVLSLDFKLIDESQTFENGHTCVAFQKGKQHKASCKAKLVSFVSQPLQMLHIDYGYNFMQKKIHVDDESAICVIKNHVYHSKTKHIEIRHHFIRDSYEKRQIKIVKIHTNNNVADLLTKAFDTSAKVKKVNDEVRIQALVNGKRVNIKESSVRRIIRLDDAEGTSCLTNTETFEGLARMSAKTTSWNEFSSTMASTIICLATNQKFNFSRYILLSLVKNIKGGVPFFMFPRFVQLIINHHLGYMTNHKDIFNTPSLTKKVFANMKRVDDEQPIPIPIEPSTFKTQKKNKPKRKHTKVHEVPSTESLAEHNVSLPSSSHDPLPSGEDILKLKELMDLCTNLSNKVLDLESEVIDIKYTYKEKIEKLESRVKRLEEENRVLKELKGVHSTIDSYEPVMEKEESSKQERKIAAIDANVLSLLDVNDEEHVGVEEVVEVVTAAKLITEVVTTAGVDVNAVSVQDIPISDAEVTKVTVEVHKPRKRRGFIIQDLEETTTVIVQPKIQAKDKGKVILIKEPTPLKRQVQINLDKEVARQLEAELNADINWNDMIEQVKRSERLTDVVMKYQALKRKPLTKAQASWNMIVYLKNMVNEGIKVPEKEVRQEKEVEVESSKREGESLEQEIAKKQKMEKETEKLKKRLKIVPDSDDDVPSAPIIEESVSDSEDESETTAPQIAPRFVQSTEQVKPPSHSVQPVETSILAATPKPTILTLSKPIFNTVVRPVSVVVSKIMVTRPRLTHSPVTKSKSPIRWHITRSSSPKTRNSPPKVTAVKASVVSVAQDYELAARLRAEMKITNQSLKEESNMILSDLSSHSTRSEEVFGYILLVKIKLLIKKLDD